MAWLLPFPQLSAAVGADGALLDQSMRRKADRFFADLECYAEALREKRRGGVPC